MAEFSSDASRLILGGHSFIQQLGNDPAADEELQIEIVRACLDAGITTFDTTYQPERVALGRALSVLGRRDEATIIAWNFFKSFGPGDEVGGPAPYRPEHWDILCEQLGTDHIEVLVLHSVGNPAEDAAQLELAMRWQAEGKLDRLGIWAPPEDLATRWPDGGPYALAVMRCNVAEPNTERLASARAVGWETLLNRRGTTWRGLPAAETADVDEGKAVALMLAHPALVKRPVFETNGTCVVGFKAEQQAALRQATA